MKQGQPEGCPILTFCRIHEKIVLRVNAGRMILSVVIVTYNVKFFLEQCLYSLKKAIDGSPLTDGLTEVFIIDNASSDGSLDFLIPQFPAFHFIRNNENTGFAKANNQAISQCSGEYILFLNPDTILAEDCLDICLSFFKSTGDAGALGLHMIDGSGNYLKESKRGFPTPWASFFKVSGFTRLFPESKFFSGYYMGHLHEGSSHAVDILSGAFMMIKKTVLDLTGGFDEQFFMYAEDIDLSIRISKTGYKNYYLSQSTIIHFKGESTRKDSRHIKIFYSAMELFMKKHFSKNMSSFHLHLLIAGVRFSRTVAYLQSDFKKSTGYSATPWMVFIKGEPEEKEKWKQRLAELGIPTSDNEKEAQEIIYCESTLQSWKSIMAELINNKNQYWYKFSGAGTHAAVGSRSSREQGKVFEI
ncbi:MAG TPA: glycosyltransferase family 2 protein [Puia sp.]|jgi:GT2 family glycosyltransferase|nr:glycosyltransferase family 2 protein [Puia sp.]